MNEYRTGIAAALLLTACTLLPGCLTPARQTVPHNKVGILLSPDENPGRWTPIGISSGGVITAMAIAPDGTMFAASDVAGVLRSLDDGATWETANTGITSAYTTSILCAASGPVVLIGNHGGIYRSENNGDTWRSIRNGFPEPAFSAHSAPVNLLASDETDPRIVYCGLDRPTTGEVLSSYLYRSDDFGLSWKALKPFPGGAPAAVAAIRARGERILAATMAGLFESSDAGASWRKLSGLPNDLVSDVLIHPDDPDLLHAVTYSEPGIQPWQGGVWKSVDGGTTWEKSSYGLEAHSGETGGSFYGTSQYRNLVRDPEDPECLYVCNISWGSCGVYRSTNGGAYWKNITPSQNDPRLRGWLSFWDPAPYPIPLYIHPQKPRTLYMGGPVLYSQDRGDHWEQIYCREESEGSKKWMGNGLNVTCLYDVVFDPHDPLRIYAGFWDIGFLASEDGGRSWVQSSTGLKYKGNIFHIQPDPVEPGRIWASTGRWEWLAGDLAVSGNYGKTWKVIGSTRNGLPDHPIYDFIVTVDADGKRRILALSYGKGPYLSTNGGKNWLPASGGLSGSDLRWGRALAVDPKNSDVLYAAGDCGGDSHGIQGEHDRGGVWRSMDGGANWKRIPVATADIKDIAVSPHNTRVILIAAREFWDPFANRLLEGGVFISYDRGETWTHCLDLEFAQTLTADPSVPGRFYVGTMDHPYRDVEKGEGVLRSDDWGETWHHMNEGLGFPKVSTLAVDPADSEHLAAGTSGCGLYAIRGISSMTAQDE